MQVLFLIFHVLNIPGEVSLKQIHLLKLVKLYKIDDYSGTQWVAVVVLFCRAFTLLALRRGGAFWDSEYDSENSL